MPWEPTTVAEMQSIVCEELKRCSDEERTVFVTIRTPLKKTPIVRYGKLESVFVLARDDGWHLIFEDIEQGFEWCKPDPDGVIRQYGFSQQGLQAALYDYVQHHRSV